jgi:hypothetical protein
MGTDHQTTFFFFLLRRINYRGVGDKVYIIDKTENNPLTVTSNDGRTHPAWAVSYDINTNEVRAMDVESNPFCAGGMSLANGSWAVFGGNQPITTGTFSHQVFALFVVWTRAELFSLCSRA